MFEKRMNMIPASIHIVGCGGTGSRLVPLVAQLVRSHPLLSSTTNIFLYDGDEVELKNLSRQNFAPADIGKNKAMVLAARYGKAYGVPIIAMPEYIPVIPDIMGGFHDATNETAVSMFNRGYAADNGRLANVLSPSNVLGRMGSFNVLSDADREKALERSSIWISCVDNVDARLTLMSMLLSSSFVSRSDQYGMNVFRDDNAPSRSLGTLPSRAPIFIDAGNENTFGQVRVCESLLPAVYGIAQGITTSSSLNTVLKKGDPLRDIFSNNLNITHVPMYMDVLPYLENVFNPPEVEASCADLDQTLAINSQMAIGIVSFLQNILLNHPLKMSACYYDIHNGNSQDKLDQTWLRKIFGIAEDVPVDVKGKGFEELHKTTLHVPNIMKRGTSDTLEIGLLELYRYRLEVIHHQLDEVFKAKNIRTLPSKCSTLSAKVLAGIALNYFVNNTSMIEAYVPFMCGIHSATNNVPKVDPVLIALMKASGPSAAADALKTTEWIPATPPVETIVDPEEEEARKAAEMAAIMQAFNAAPIVETEESEPDDEEEEEEEED